MNLLGRKRRVLRRAAGQTVESEVFRSARGIVDIDYAVLCTCRATPPIQDTPLRYGSRRKTIFVVELLVWQDILGNRTEIHEQHSIPAGISLRVFREGLEHELHEINVFEAEVRKAFGQPLGHTAPGKLRIIEESPEIPCVVVRAALCRVEIDVVGLERRVDLGPCIPVGEDLVNAEDPDGIGIEGDGRNFAQHVGIDTVPCKVAAPVGPQRIGSNPRGRSESIDGTDGVGSRCQSP